MNLLWRPVSLLYGSAAYLRRKFYQIGLKEKKSLPVPVVSIGNLSVGGTGKTPFTIFFAKSLQQKGYKVCVLSRGYKRKSKGIIVIPPERAGLVGWEKTGDEPYLIAKEGIPVVVGSNRFEAGKKALSELKPDIFLLDDGFQHFQLHRELDILLVDATRPFWKDRLLPAGKLREPVSFYKYADVLIVNRMGRLDRKEQESIIRYLKQSGKRFYFTEERIEGLYDGKDLSNLSILENKKVGVFSGLGNNEQFFKLISEMEKRYNFKVMKKVPFPDHYNYRTINLPENLDMWITTEKDIIKISRELIKAKNIYALKYTLSLDKQAVDSLEKMIFYEELKNP